MSRGSEACEACEAKGCEAVKAMGSEGACEAKGCEACEAMYCGGACEAKGCEACEAMGSEGACEAVAAGEAEVREEAEGPVRPEGCRETRGSRRGSVQDMDGRWRVTIEKDASKGDWVYRFSRLTMAPN